MTHRIKIAQSVMDRAGEFGLHELTPNLAQLLKKMARESGIASGNFNDQRRRYGAFILTIRDNNVVDINCNEDDYCTLCLGIEINSDGMDCVCTDDEPYDPEVKETVGGNHW